MLAETSALLVGDFWPTAGRRAQIQARGPWFFFRKVSSFEVDLEFGQWSHCWIQVICSPNKVGTTRKIASNSFGTVLEK